MWFRLRRVLADAATACAISEQDARLLIAEGYRADASGAGIAPEKTIVFVDERRLSGIEGRRPIPVGLGPEFLAARWIALIPFDETRS